MSAATPPHPPHSNPEIDRVNNSIHFWSTNYSEHPELASNVEGKKNKLLQNTPKGGSSKHNRRTNTKHRRTNTKHKRTNTKHKRTNTKHKRTNIKRRSYNTPSYYRKNLLFF
jgi:hypothetical protein